MKFSRQEYWSGLPFSPGDLANPGIEPASLASPALTGGFFTTSTTWKAQAHNKLLLLFFPKQSRFMEWDCFLKSLCTYGGPMGQSLKGMATHSSTLAWKIPWTEEPGRLQSMGSLRVGHDWATSLSLFTFMHWRRKWQPTPVFLPGESQGWQSLVGCHLWGPTESDTTEVT